MQIDTESLQNFGPAGFTKLYNSMTIENVQIAISETSRLFVAEINGISILPPIPDQNERGPKIRVREWRVRIALKLARFSAAPEIFGAAAAGLAARLELAVDHLFLSKSNRLGFV